MYFLCRVAFISLMFRGRHSVYFAASDTTRHSGLFILLQQNLMKPYVRGVLEATAKWHTMSVRLSLSLCLCLPSVCLCTSSFPPKPVSFHTDFQKLLIYVVWAYADIFVQVFFEPVTRNVGNEPLESSQTLHKDRSNLLAFWIPNSTKESPSLEAYHLSRSEKIIHL